MTPYDYNVCEQVFHDLFTQGKDRPDGLKEIPAASLQLLVSGMEYALLDLSGEDRQIMKKAIGIMEYLRDAQKMNERR